MNQKYFNSRYTFDRSRKKVWRAISQYLQRYIPATAEILELGAGYGDLINQIKAQKKYAADINPEVANFCSPEVKFINAPLGRINLADNSLDAILASNLLEHLNAGETDALFDQANRLLKTGGKIILIQPNIRYCCREYWDDFTHVKAYSDVSLKDLLVSRGFKIVKVEKRFLPFSFKSFLPKSYWLTKIYLMLPWRPMAKQMLIIAEK
ncbi:MAG: class I SAM-dependent methyltransferase [Patescibacteria group bacterium]|nr:class I SAM-dependent methyltransferase [Patescibacteria group bacterium]